MPSCNCLCSFTTLLGLLGLVLTADAGEAELARVKSEWPAAARRLDVKFAKARGTARVWSERPRDASASYLAEARFAIDHGMEKVEMARLLTGSKPKKLADFVYCRGDDGSAFQLQRREGASSYDVEGIGSRPQEQHVYVTVFGRFVHASHGVMGRAMTQVFESPGFEITAAEDCEQAGVHLMKVDCLSGPAAPKDRITLVLDPGKGWDVQSCQYRMGKDPDTARDFQVEYRPARADVRLPHRVTFTGPTKVVYHCEFTDWTFAPTPLAEFNMTYYGLPDLIHRDSRTNRLPWWFAAVGLVLGLGAVAARRLASRTSKHSLR